MRLRQRIRVNVSRPGGGEETVLKTARATLRSRLLRRFVGDQYAVLVLTPVGRNVDTVEIHESRDMGEALSTAGGGSFDRAEVSRNE